MLQGYPPTANGPVAIARLLGNHTYGTVHFGYYNLVKILDFLVVLQRFNNSSTDLFRRMNKKLALKTGTIISHHVLSPSHLYDTDRSIQIPIRLYKNQPPPAKNPPKLMENDS